MSKCYILFYSIVLYSIIFYKCIIIPYLQKMEACLIIPALVSLEDSFSRCVQDCVVYYPAAV